jgi:hypothetical protein
MHVEASDEIAAPHCTPHPSLDAKGTSSVTCVWTLQLGLTQLLAQAAATSPSRRLRPAFSSTWIEDAPMLIEGMLLHLDVTAGQEQPTIP